MKKGKKKSMALAAGVLAALTLLSSCGTKDNGNQGTASGAPDADVSQSVPAGNTGDTLRVIITGEPVTIMPLEQEAGEGQWIAWCIYDRLVNYDAATGVLTPALATSWEWVDDTHLRFHLRDDVKAYDGSVITADDVMFSVERGLEGDAATQWSMVDGTECKVEDEHTFVLGLKESYPSIIGKLAYVATLNVIDQSSCEALGGYEAAIRNPKCGTGAYDFDEWKEGEYIRLVRNEDYWGEAGAYEYIQFTWINDSAARTMAVAAGDADFAVEIGTADVAAAESYDNCTSVSLSTGGTNVLFFNTTREYTGNELIRKAIACVVDVNACNMIGTGGTARVADSIIASSSSYYKAPNSDYSQTVDIEKGKALLAEAGYPNGVQLTMPTVPMTQTVCEALQASLLQIGIDLKVEVMEIPTYLAATDSGDFDIVLQPTFSDDITNYAKYYDDRMELNARGGGIVGGYEDLYPVLDRCRYSTDEADNMAAWGELQDYVRDHCLTIPLYESSVNYCTNGSYEYNYFSNGHINFATARPVG